MNFECETCEALSPLEKFQPVPGGLRVHCNRCDGDFFVATQQTADPAPSVSPTSASEPACPKCLSAVASEAEACAKCGLSKTLFDSWADSEFDDDDGVLRTLWEACESDWSDAERHDLFLERASVQGAYQYAARKYRQRSRENAGDATADTQLQRIAQMAEAAVFTSHEAKKHVDKPKGFRGGLIVFMVGLLIASVVAAFVMWERARGSQITPRQGARQEIPGTRGPRLVPSGGPGGRPRAKRPATRRVGPPAPRPSHAKPQPNHAKPRSSQPTRKAR